MGQLEFMFPLLFIVLGTCSASGCDHMTLNVCQNLVTEMQQEVAGNHIEGACEKYQAATDCFQDFVDRCYKGAEKEEQLNQLITGMPQMAAICEDDSSSAEKLKRLNCLRKETVALEEGDGSCAKDLMASQQIKGESIDEETLKKACCAFIRYQKCWKDILIEKCGERAYNYAMPETNDRLNAVKVVCDKYDCSGSGIMSVLPLWLMTGLVAVQVLMGPQ